MKEEAIFLNMEGNPPTEKEEVKRVMVADTEAKCSFTSPRALGSHFLLPGSSPSVTH